MWKPDNSIRNGIRIPVMKSETPDNKCLQVPVLPGELQLGPAVLLHQVQSISHSLRQRHGPGAGDLPLGDLHQGGEAGHEQGAAGAPLR